MESARHHYIPKYYIKGFVNPDGLLFVYDKTKDRIIGRKPPKSIFYEWDRNSISNQSEKNSVIEDKLYGYVDSLCSPTFDWYRNQPNVDEIHDKEKLSKLKIFATNLYWRLPVNDRIFNNFWERKKIKVKANSGEEIFDSGLEDKILKDLNYKKIARSNLDVESINNAINKSKGEKLHNKLFDFAAPKLLLGDNPIVYRVQPKTIDEIVYSDLAFAISSNRLFYEMSEGGTNIDDHLANFYNTIVIHQSVQYICSPDEKILEKSVEDYKKASRQQLVPFFQNMLFKTTIQNK